MTRKRENVTFRCAQMRLYTMHKGQFLLTAIMFGCLFLIALLMGMAGPNITVDHLERAKEKLDGDDHAHNASSLAAGPYYLLTPRLNVYRQQLWLSVKVLLASPERGTSSTPFTVWLSAAGVDSQPSALPKPLLTNSSRLRSLKCADGDCKSLIVLHLGSLAFDRYQFIVRFQGLENVEKHFGMDDVLFTMTTYNPEFTSMELWFRFFFLCCALTASAAFLVAMRHHRTEEWALEQKWCLALLLLLCLFDDPAFPLAVLSGWPPSLALADALQQAAFVFGLLFYWLCIFHGLRQTERGFFNFYLIKTLLV